MALTDLPDRPWPLPQSIEWEPIDFGSTMEGELGGSAQRVNRPGNRWQVTIPLPPMAPDQADEWAAKAVSGLQTGVRWRIIQPGIATGSPGSVRVAGAGQAGFTLNVDGLTPGFPARRGRKLSLLIGGRRYVHMLAAPFRAAADGTATLTFSEAMRALPGDNDVVELGKPYLEGLIATPRWRLETDLIARGLALTIREAR